MNRINATESSYYQRYRGAAVRFQVIGGVLLLIGILADRILGTSMLAVSLIFAGPGALLLIVGGSSMRPHNLVKAFAQQCAREPGREIAQGLLDALTQSKKVHLVGNSIRMVENAIGIYEETGDADPELVGQLRAAAGERILKRAF